MGDQKLISVVFSFRNEADVLPELLTRMKDALEPLPYSYELVFVNDDSTDNSLDILMDAAATAPEIRIITMSARYGVNPCILAGIRHAQGDAVITMDTDLQDPPEVIPELLKAWEEGADIVHATRSKREGETAIKLFITKMAYRFLHFISEVQIPVDTGMFKLMSRRVADIIGETDERDPYLRGLIAWAGYDQAQVYYRREKRAAGETHFPLWSKGPTQEFISGMVSFSNLPLVFFVLAGICLGGIILLLMAVGVLATLIGKGPDGLFWVLNIGLLIAALQLLGIGVLGLYMARVYAQVRHRPDYVIKDTHNISK